jgi:uncharacterized membrane protein YgdD (TMEM256/DUF423 family)
MDRFFFAAGSLLAFLAVALGAFAAHSLKARLPGDMLTIFETGVRYHMYHALALLLTALLAARLPGKAIMAAGWLFIAGIVLFSGSLYVLAVTGVTALGAITPFGGVAFLAGWAALAIAAL